MLHEMQCSTVAPLKQGHSPVHDVQLDLLNPAQPKWLHIETYQVSCTRSLMWVLQGCRAQMLCLCL